MSLLSSKTESSWSSNPSEPPSEPPSPSPFSSSGSSKTVHTPADDPAAIVGLACRVPGANNPSQLWKLIEEQRDMQRKMPEDRFNVDAFYHPDGANKGTTNAKYGYFLDQDLGNFDASFFNISGKEAEAMDPQQRLLLEVVYEALEDAGIPLESVNGSQASVFCGCFTNDYRDMTVKDLEDYPKYSVTGTGNSILANRISYFYNLHGASATVDTACSSSLVCFHMGNQSLRNNEADLSIVVGSALHFDPNIFITMTDLGMLSTDGRCRAFDASGRGYVRGEGICAAILKRKSRAELDGDTIRALVRGTGVNHDGRKQGITLPSPEAQEALIRRTYASAGLDPADTQYFEAHGTGTAAGDPRETRAIGAIFSKNRTTPLVVGSIKTNIGHLEGASGLAGIIKATLSIQNRKMLPNMHFNNPNPEIAFDDWKISVPTKLMDWESSNELRRASINSFGYGGTNAHVILEQYNPPQRNEIVPEEMPERLAKMAQNRPFLIPLSSHSEKAGKLLTGSLATFFKEHPETAVQDLAHSLSFRRSVHKQRSFAIGNDRNSAVEDLENPKPIAKWTLADGKPRIGFVMTGQGGQWFAMGRQLIEQSPLFRQTLERCDSILQNLPDSPNWSVVEELLKTKETTRLAETQFSQPICTALQLAILDLLEQWGIKPSAVVGHSSGEMAAAYAAGILSFENTIVAAYYRGLYMSNGVEGLESKPGAMMAVGMSEAEAMSELKAYTGRIALAAINSPSTMTLSGDADAILELKEKLTERKVFARQLQVTQAFHSHHMDPLAPGYKAALNGHPGFAAESAKVRMFSSVTARVANSSKMGASYWVANMTGAVRFSDALTGILLDDEEEQNVDVLVEIGPHPALKGPSRQVLQSLKLDIPYVASLARGSPDFEGLLAAAGQLYQLGYPVDLVATNSDHFISQDGSIAATTTGKKLDNLPTYSWDHQRYWAETRVIKDHRLRKNRNAILGALVPGSVASHPRFRNYLRLKELPWLTEHVVDGKIIFPAAGYISMAIQARAGLIDSDVDIKEIMLRDISVKSALTLTEDDAGTETILELRPISTSAKDVSDSWHEFAVFSFDSSGRSMEHCRGLISAEQGSPAPVKRIQPYDLPSQLEKQSNRRIPLHNYYQHLDALGLSYGENFRLLSGDVESGPGFAMAPLAFRQYQISTEKADIPILHPTFLDASFHVIFAAIETILGRPLDEPFIPTFLRSMTVSGAFASNKAANVQQNFQVCSNTSLAGHRVAASDLRVHGEGFEDLLIDVQGLQLTALGSDASENGSGRSLFFRTRWQPAFDFLGTSNDSAVVSSLAQVMDIYAHQHPNSSILHLTSNVASSKEALRFLGGCQGERRRFKSYTPFSTSGQSFEELEGTWIGLTKVQEPKEVYDVVIVGEEANYDVKTLVKDGGCIVSDGTPINADGLTRLFSDSGFTAWRKGQTEINHTEPLTLVVSSGASDRTKAIVSSIETKNKGPVSKLTLAELSRQSEPSGNMIVLSSLDEDLFFNDDAGDAEAFDAVRDLLTQQGRNIVWALEGATMDSAKPEHAIIHGLARSARSENEQLRLVMLDLPQESTADRISQRLMQVLDPNIAEDEITERGGTLHIPKVEADDTLNAKLPNTAFGGPRLERFGQDRPLALKIGKVGLLETLVFGDDEQLIDSTLQEDELEIEVKASAINFRDIAASMGIIEDHRLGDECAGIVVAKGKKVDDSAFQVGDRVVAWRPGQGAHRTIVRNPASLCYKLGPMPFGVAAAMPLILTTAYYSLMDVARLQPGETILVHSAAGGVGQMAVQLAHMVGAKVLATVGSQAKRDLLKEKLGLSDDQMFSSRDESFVAGVMKATNGRGVDVALNSLAGSLLHATWSCIAPFGRFIEIGKRDIHSNSKIGMDPFRKSVTFASVDLITMFERNKQLGARVFQECCNLVHEGVIQPPETVQELPYSEIQKGFRLLQMGKHTGKVVMIPNKDDMVPVLPSKFRNTQLFQPSKTYLLVGGLGGLGRTLAEWMVRKGARSLAFLSRSGADKPEAKATIDWLKIRDIQTMVCRGDITKYADVQACIESIGDNLAGVFQAAMVLHDGPLDQMTYKQWQTCVRPKVRGTYNLHKATLPQTLDFFVCFSSVSTVLGSKGQANYSASNDYLDALMRHRREMGLKGTTMNCGMIVGVGAVAENAALQKVMERIGYDPVEEHELLYQIEEAVMADNTETSSARGLDRHQIITGINLGRQELYWSQKPLFRNLYANHDSDSDANKNAGSMNLSALLASAADPAERIDILTTAFIEKVAAVLAVAPDNIRSSDPLSAYGLDSIVAVEFRKWFAKSVGVDLALFDVLGSKSINALIAKAASMIKADGPKAAESDEKAKVTTKTADGEQAAESVQELVDALIKIEKPDAIPMSTFQSRLWFLHNLMENKAFLNLPVVFHLKGKPVFGDLKKALVELVKRNDILRTSYFDGDDFAEQKPIDDFDVELEYEDFSSETSPRSAVEEFVEELRNQELEIEDGEVMRTTLTKLDDDVYALVLLFHHISIDRGSSKSFLSQLTSIYDAIREQKSLETVPSPKILYSDFTLWHNAQLASAALEPDVKFWKEKFTGTKGASQLLPFAKSERPPQNDYQRAIHKGTLPLSTLKRMKRVCARTGTTPFQFLLTAFRSFLYRYTEEKDLTILMIDGNRPHPDLEDVLGFFVNMIPIRCVGDCETGFDNLLEDIKDTTLEAMEHSKVPFDAIVDAVQAEKDPSHFPLGQIVVNYQIHGKMANYPTKDFDIHDIQSEDVPTACELNLEAMEDPDEGLNLRLEYSTTLYDDKDMDRFFDNFLAFIGSCVKDHRQPVSEIPMCGPKEIEHLRANYWATETTENKWNDMSVLEKISENARVNPQAMAITTSEDETVTYKELLDQARKIAFTLRRRGVTPGQYIGLYVRPGIEAVAAMLAILLNRCAYVAMDPEFAADRLAFMVSDCRAETILAGRGLGMAATEIGLKTGLSPQIFEISEAASEESRLSLLRSASPEDPFYMIYTSGSTGKPKGVILTQSNTQQMLSTLHHDYEFAAKDRFLQQSSICFDLSVVQIFSALTAGAAICIASAPIRKDPFALAEFMQRTSVSVTYFTPTQFALLLEYANDTLRACNAYRVAYFAGERLPVRVAKAFYDLETPATLYNTWSPSELVVQTTIHKTEYPDESCTSIPIGFPMANCRHYIMDSCLNPLPAGLVGEICVGGAQVGAGYLNRPDANAKYFVNNPFCEEEDRVRGWDQVFRTGDKGRFRPDGQLEFHGRIAGDKQIKLRGYRIDLGEVEQRLYLESSTDGVQGLIDVSVVARSTAPDTSSLTDDRQIIAFVVPRQPLNAKEKQSFVTSVHQRLATHLNAYMLPSGYEFLDNLPVTIGGKVDRRNLLSRSLDLVLPSNGAQQEVEEQTSSTPVDPKVMNAIIEIFREMLKIPKDRQIEPTDSFFDLGGQSILLLRLKAKLKRAFKTAPSLGDLFKVPTPAGVHDLVVAKSQNKKKSTKTAKVAAKTIDWDLETTLPNETRYSVPAGAKSLSRNDISKILLTGVDSYIGAHMLRTLLEAQPSTMIYVLGSQRRAEKSDLVEYLEKYKLLDDTIAEDTLNDRVQYVAGTLAEPHFGLKERDFKRLGQKIQAIYHLGGQISLLKTYTDLKRLNVSAVLDIIELAAQAKHLTEIHHLSTWSVPHLQTWKTSTRSAAAIVTDETSSAHFAPPPSDELGYFKSRWASEMLLTRAAERGFRVGIHRASAVSASARTRVPEPADDFIRRMVLGMIASRCAPRIGAAGEPGFAVDFVPVDYLVETMHKLAGCDTLRREELSIFHIGNERPLEVAELPGLMGDIRADGKDGQTASLEEWLDVVSTSEDEEDQLRWAVLKDYFTGGHNMFALDQTKTWEAMAVAGASRRCPPMDAKYLREMFAQELTQGAKEE